MDLKLFKFSSRVNLVCGQSDPAQPVHFLSQIIGPIGRCAICGKEEHFAECHLYCDNCDLEFHKECYFRPRCRLSDVAEPHNLVKKSDGMFFCFACSRYISVGKSNYYHCKTCNLDFHESCYLYLPVIRTPFHFSHPLKFTFSSPKESLSFSDLNIYRDLPSSWLNESEIEEHEASSSDASSSISQVKCKCCQKHLHEMYYHCSICNYSLNLTCTKNPPPLTILNKKSHEHPLTLFPRRIPLPCDACGLSLDNTHDVVYTCHPCNYMIHRTCIYLPRVIKITRHQHRLSLSSSLPSRLFPCGVCRYPINVTYGQFSCRSGCDYAVHSKCGVKGRVWDGKDLEGVPEDPDEDMDIEPFVWIDEETIQHFSHEHHLRFHKRNNVCDENKFCQACILPVLASESFYSCIQCEFVLHEACASLRRKKDHPLHKHPLVLHPFPLEKMVYTREIPGRAYYFSFEGIFKCNGCDQLGCGYMYKCSKEGCEFQLDIRCASLPDPVIHGCHPHELFFNLTKGQCMGCKSSHCSPFSLECIECKSFLGLKCASLPSVIHYKHDKHPLTLCYGKEDTRNGQYYWCEICEAKLDAKEWFYKCDEYCSVTVHIGCLLGKDIFMKPMFIKLQDIWISVLRNSGNTRPTCCVCLRRSKEPFLLEMQDEYNFCSFRCLTNVEN